MRDILDIAKKNIESAEKSIKTVNQTIILSFILLCLSWIMVIEPIYQKTKYENINLQEYIIARQRILNDDSLSKTDNKEYQKKLKKNANKINNISASLNDSFEKFIEESVPAPFNHIFALAALPQIGFLSVSLCFTILISALFYNRKKNLKKLSVALRMIKISEGNFNDALDYGLNIPFWMMPIPKDSEYLSKNELIRVFGLSEKKALSFILLILFIIFSISVQIRIAYLCFITLSDPILLTAAVVFCLITLSLVVYWFLPYTIKDSYNSEKPIYKQQKRDFLVGASLFLSGTLFGLYSPNLKRAIVASIKSPRFKKRSSNKKADPFESNVLRLLAQSKTLEASNMLISRLGADSLKHYYNIRLYDLLALLCRLYLPVKEKHFEILLNLSKNGPADYFQSRIKNWQDPSWRRLSSSINAEKKDNIFWNNQKL